MKSITIRDQSGNIILKVSRTKTGIDVDTLTHAPPIEITAMCYTDKPKRYTKVKVRTGERK